jgi:hypothetical protein
MHDSHVPDAALRNFQAISIPYNPCNLVGMGKNKLKQQFV